jgi:DNA-directed RNA polymerase subunit RPC12/RpoP
MLTTTVYMQFECETCGKTFTAIQGLNYHVKRNVCQRKVKLVACLGTMAAEPLAYCRRRRHLKQPTTSVRPLLPS